MGRTTNERSVRASAGNRGPARPPLAAEPARLLKRNCSVDGTISILSDAWTFLIIREAFFGAKRFEEFRSRLGLPRGTLSDRLKRLVEDGIFRMARHATSPTRLEYRLSRRGTELYPSFVALMQFGDRWLAGAKGKPLTLIHNACGLECSPYVACSECAMEVKAVEVSYRDGPGAGETEADPVRQTRRSSGAERFCRGRPSSVSRALEIIGDRWSFLILREAFFGERRFDRFQTQLGVATNILAERLSRLVSCGFFEKRRYQEQPDRYEYRLTDIGRDVYGAFILMAAWGDRWLHRNRPPIVLTHQTCGRDFTPVLLCDRCRQPIEAHAMRYRMNYNPADYGIPAQETEELSS